MSASENLIYTTAPAADAWIELGALEDLFDDGQCYGTVINGLKIGLFYVDDQVYCVDDICTHGNALLSEGDLEGHEIECPLHAGAFDVRDGKALCSPLIKDTRVHNVRVEDGVVFVQLNL